jgi:hypothetical protein
MSGRASAMPKSATTGIAEASPNVRQIHQKSSAQPAPRARIVATIAITSFD